jgi:hypothetical protein
MTATSRSTSFAAVIVVLLAALAGCGGGGGAREAGGGAEPADGPPVREGFSRGANVTAYAPHALAAAPALEALRALRDAGADHATFPILWFQEDATSTEVLPDARETPTDESLLQAARAARDLGMTVGIAPHVNVRDGTFRGEIAPASRQAWLRSYRRMVEHYAELARQADADLLVVGSELSSMTGDEAAWRELVAAARDRFPGQLTYAANWVQEAERIRFWDALDVVGVDAYMPLTPEDPDPSPRELQVAWRPWVERLQALHDKTGKPVRLTELGYASRIGTAQEPAVEGDGPIDDGAQARAYDAAFRAVGHRDWIAGADVWDWSADARQDAGDYSPQGKEAEAVLARWFGGARSRASGR